MDRLTEPVVGGIPIVAQYARPVRADGSLQGVRTPLRVDAVPGDLITNPHVQPGTAPTDTPTGLIDRQLLRGPDRRQDLPVLGLQPGARPAVDLSTGPARQGDPEQGAEHGRHLAVGQSGLGVQQSHGRLGVGAELTGGRAQRVGRLQRMAPVGASATRATVPDVDGELADQRLTRDLGLELLGGAGLDERTATVLACLGERGVVAFGDRSGRKGSVPMRAMGITGLAPRLLGIGLGRPLVEWGRLTLAGACRLFELPGQFGDPSLEFGQPFLGAPATGTRGLIHAGIVATGDQKSPCPTGGR